MTTCVIGARSVACLLLLAGLGTSCASMPTKQRRAREAAELGLVAHPELGDIMAAIARLDTKYDTLLAQMHAVHDSLLAKMNIMEEAHRDDTELVLEALRRTLEELKLELARVRR